MARTLPFLVPEPDSDSHADQPADRLLRSLIAIVDTGSMMQATEHVFLSPSGAGFYYYNEAFGWIG